jgi:excinuclease ABC subunit C
LVLFDKKFGKAFITTIPSKPGVYSFTNEQGGVVYVGKAKNLRRRLGQYRRARGGKMRTIVKAARTLTWTVLETELDACIAELRRIQQDRPKLNIAGAFSHRYPLIGLRTDGADSYLCFTTTPDLFAAYRFHGAFRSRFVTAEAFFSLVRLLQFVGHPLKPKTERKAYSYEFGFRRLPAALTEGLPRFLRGQSSEFLETLVLKLLDNAGARAKRKDTQEGVDALDLFWRQECEPLAKAIATVGFQIYPVPQTERDPLFIRAGFEQREETDGLEETLEPA